MTHQTQAGGFVPDALTAPIAIGGVGGSGTRLIAAMLRELGLFMGGDLNVSEDNLWFTLLFKRREILDVTAADFSDLVALFVAAMSGSGTCAPAQLECLDALAARDRLQHDAAWLRKRADAMQQALQQAHPPHAWGWKEPNTHVVVDRMRRAVPGLRYIHVMRNGLDMAYSANQNQLALWGPHFLGREVTISAHDSLAYWCAVHRRVRDLGAAMGEDFLLLDYDHLCLHPRMGVQHLLRFLKLELPTLHVDALAGQVRTPPSVGRYRAHGLSAFDPLDVAFVRELGYAVNTT